MVQLFADPAGIQVASSTVGQVELRLTPISSIPAISTSVLLFGSSMIGLEAQATLLRRMTDAGEFVARLAVKSRQIAASLTEAADAFDQAETEVAQQLGQLP